LLELGAEALEVGNGGLNEVGGLGEDVHFDAAVGAGKGEVGAAEQKDSSVDDDEFFMEGFVGAAPEEGLDAVAGELGGEIGIGAAHGGRRGGAIFDEDDNLDAGSGFFAEGSVEIFDGSGAAVAEVVGGNPDGVSGRTGGFEEGFAEGFGGEEANFGGGGGFGEISGDGVEAEEFGGLGWIGIEDVSSGFAGNALDLGGGPRRDENISGGGFLNEATGKLASVAEENQVGRVGLG